MKSILFLLCLLLLPLSIFGIDKVTIGKNKEILVDGKAFFPMMSTLQEEKSMDKNIAVGVNTFVGVWKQTPEKAKKYLEVCKQKNVYAILDFEESVKNHPNLLGWIQPDEPDMPNEKNKPRTSPDESIAHYNKAKAKDKNHPMFLNLTANFNKKMDVAKYSDVSFYKKYKDATDIIGFDTYPIFGWMRVDDLWWVGSGVEELRKLTDDKLPTYAWIETIGGSRWLSPALQREPLAYEIKCEMYMSIVKGVKAIALWTHRWVAENKLGVKSNNKKVANDSPDYTTFGINQKNRDMLKIETERIKRLTPVIVSPDVNGKVSKKEGGKIEIMTKEFESKFYVFAVNFERKAGKAGFAVEGLKKGTKIKVDAEEREIEAKEDGFFSDSFKEFDVHIYMIDR